MSKESVTPYKMNLPTALKQRIDEAAASNHRSVSGEIVARLEDSFAAWGSYSGETRRGYVMGAVTGTLELLAGMSSGRNREAFLEALSAMERMDLAGGSVSASTSKPSSAVSEGLDIPSVGAIVTRGSATSPVQAMGRALRHLDTELSEALSFEAEQVMTDSANQLSSEPHERTHLLEQIVEKSLRRRGYDPQRGVRPGPDIVAKHATSGEEVGIQLKLWNERPYVTVLAPAPSSSS